jgi:hypothetical protein
MLMTVLVLAVLKPATADDTAAAKQYQALVDEFEKEGGARIFAKSFLALADEHPKDPAAVDALLWVAGNVRGRTETTRALELLQSRHLDSKQLGPALKDVAGSRSPAAQKLLRAAMEKSPHAEIKARACYFLAKLLEAEASVMKQLKASPELAPRVLQYYGKDYGQHLTSLKPKAVEKQTTAVYELMLATFATAEVDDVTLGQIAEDALFRIRHLSVGKAAPDIKGEDTAGKPFKLSEYRGKVVMLVFWGHW